VALIIKSSFIEAEFLKSSINVYALLPHNSFVSFKATSLISTNNKYAPSFESTIAVLFPIPEAAPVTMNLYSVTETDYHLYSFNLIFQ
jgi:hypothetical protein